MTARGNLRDALRRGVALGVAVSFHLGVLILVLRPAASEPGRAPIRQVNRGSLKVRLLSGVQLLPHVVRISMPRVALPTGGARPAHPGHASPPVTMRSPAPIPAPASNPAPAARLDATISDPGVQGRASDGGFRQRLRSVQGSDTVHGVPGSDTPLVAGIHLRDPDKHGIAAVMRQGQRLFGITSHHCLDVEVWRQLTPRQLGAHHLSPRDLDRMTEKYRCNAPMGLSF